MIAASDDALRRQTARRVQSRYRAVKVGRPHTTFLASCGDGGGGGGDDGSRGRLWDAIDGYERVEDVTPLHSVPCEVFHLDAGDGESEDEAVQTDLQLMRVLLVTPSTYEEQYRQGVAEQGFEAHVGGDIVLRTARDSCHRTRSRYMDFYTCLALEAHFNITNDDEMADLAGSLYMRMYMQYGYEQERFMERYREGIGVEFEGEVSACDAAPYMFLPSRRARVGHLRAASR